MTEAKATPTVNKTREFVLTAARDLLARRWANGTTLLLPDGRVFYLDRKLARNLLQRHEAAGRH